MGEEEEPKDNFEVTGVWLECSIGIQLNLPKIEPFEFSLPAPKHPLFDTQGMALPFTGC